jgi:MoaA/NifB/PqqE/SkfB family radical SAM enzyme
MAIDDDPAPRSEAPPSFEASVRPFFADVSGAEFDRRVAVLASSGPEAWQEISFPVELGLELAAACNLSCVMCPVPRTSRPAQMMDPGLARAVVDELAGLRGFVLLPQGFGETMLHPRWAELVGYAAARGVRPIVMLTNATLLGVANLQRLLEIEVDVLVASIDGVTPETYARVRVGGRLEKVEANVLRMLEARGARRRPKLVLRIIRMQDTAAELDAFFARWRPRIGPEDEIHVNEYNDWAGKVDNLGVGGANLAAPARSPCRMLWRNLSVHADGKVCACCLDSEDELVVGDLTKGDSLAAIWRGERLQRLRRLHLEGRFGELPICARCTSWS